MDQPGALLFAVLARVAERRLGELNSQNLAKTARAFATADQPDAPFFAALARMAERRLVDKAQELTNTAWTSVTSAKYDADFWGAGADRGNAEHLATLSLALATPAWANGAFFASLAGAVEHSIGVFIAQKLADTGRLIPFSPRSWW